MPTKKKTVSIITYNKLKRSYNEIKDSYQEMIFRFALVAEFRDEATGIHLVKIADYSTEIAHEMGLSNKDVELLRYASPMHDIGKIILPDSVIKKPAKLTDKERDIIKTHPELGADIFTGSRSELLEAARQISLTHHEKFDGTGYPNGLKGEEIPLFGRIIALADVFDALTSKRPYKEDIPFDIAVKMIKEESGKHFDPKVVKAFIKRKDKIKKIWQATKDIETFLIEQDK